MQTTQFYINGHIVNEGGMLSFSVTTKMALEAIELEKNLNGRDMLAKIQTEDHIWYILVDSITTSPIEDLSITEEEDEVIEVFAGDKLEFLPGWNSLVEANEAKQERLNELRKAWDKIEVEDDPIKYIRSYFGSHDLTATHGYRVSGKMFKTYNLSMAGDYTLGFKGRNVDVEFGIDRKIDTYIDKIYDVLESWAAYEDFACTLDSKNDRLFQDGAKIYASYGIIDNIVRGKVEDLAYGPECGFTHQSYIKNGVQIELDICNRYLNDLNIEEILNSLTSDIDTKIPSLTDVLK